ncbi:interleukin-34 [Monodelphis domestica]|nr:interleukin-34 [Monodelphis domestica]XP_007477583.1 interleukin-34 [Monodelphis domestica]XP_007477584.1 interleukin-34 [Monodelphis domestica]XP_007477585.1 interleukin-34 [Monodelphis domestica]XP_016283526.1 interleukin-34 [Monodelphis domestica]XP_056680659.1 interleukin-34 [Monodelphis domestica]
MPRGAGYLSLYFLVFFGPLLESEALKDQNKECIITGILRDKLQYRHRLRYMKHYFPIDYRIRVPYEGVLRLANITRLQQAEVSQPNLRYLWAALNCNTMEIIQNVLLEDHPSRNYIKEIHELLIYVQEIAKDLQVHPQVEKILTLANSGRDQKLVRPKALLDNCYKVMDLLYCLCCKESNIQNWEDCIVPQAQPHSHPPPPQCAGPATLLYHSAQAQTSPVGERAPRSPQVEADPSRKVRMGEERIIP